MKPWGHHTDMTLSNCQWSLMLKKRTLRILTWVCCSLVPRPLLDFISQPCRNSPQLRDKIWEWPGNETRSTECWSDAFISQLELWPLEQRIDTEFRRPRILCLSLLNKVFSVLLAMGYFLTCFCRSCEYAAPSSVLCCQFIATSSSSLWWSMITS